MPLKIFVCFFTLSLSAAAHSTGYFQIHPKNITPTHMNVYTNGINWVVEKDNKTCEVQYFDLDPILRNTGISTASKIMKFGSIRLAPCGDTYKIYYNARGIGGGPLTGYIGYWTTKALGYGGVAAVAGTAIAATAPVGGIAGAAAGAAATVAGGGISAAAGVAAGGATVAGGAIAGAGAAATAAAATGILAGEAVGGTVLAIESASLGVGAFLTAIPFLP